MASDPRRTHPEQVGALVDDARAGNRAAQETLARWCLPRVRRTMMMSCSNKTDVDDLVQNVMARVLSKLHTYRGEASFYVWVDRISINELRGHYRKQRWSLERLREYGAEASFQPNPPSSLPDDQAVQNQQLQRLAYHVSKLRPNQRLPVVLHELHGYSVPEISAMLDTGFEATKKRLQRGRTNLRSRLQKDPACRAYFGGH